MRRVSRSVPRSSDSDELALLRGHARSQVRRSSSSIEASCAASGVRNSCEMLASTRIACAAHGLELGLIAHDLHLQAVDHARSS